jgi:hypothetical protein
MLHRVHARRKALPISDNLGYNPSMTGGEAFSRVKIDVLRAERTRG